MTPVTRHRSDERGPIRIAIDDDSVCYYCGQTPLLESHLLCPNCGFPQRKSEKQQRDFIMEKRLLSIELKGLQDQIRKAQVVVFLLAFQQLVGAIIATRLGMLNVAVELLITATFLALGFVAAKRPFEAVLMALSIYLLEIALVAVVSPMSLFAGLVFKVIFIGALIYGLKAAREAKRLEAELRLKRPPQTKTGQR